MKAWEIIGYAYRGELLCAECGVAEIVALEAKGVEDNGDSGECPQPIFASDEIQPDDYCANCASAYTGENAAADGVLPAHCFLSGEVPDFLQAPDDDQIAVVTNSAVDTLLWSETIMLPELSDNEADRKFLARAEAAGLRDGDNFEGMDLNDTDKLKLREECADFLTQAMRELRRTFTEAELDLLGHDFIFTRNGHGAGFWDGDWPARMEDGREEGAALTTLSKAWRNISLYLGDDLEPHTGG